MPFSARGGFLLGPPVTGGGGGGANSWWDNQGAAATLSTVTFTNDGTSFDGTNKQFGTHSLDASPSGTSIYIPSYNSSTTGGGWPVGTDDFCLEGWVWVPSDRSRAAASSGDYYSFNVSGGLGVRFGDRYRGTFDHLSIWARGQADLDVADYVWPTETWTHFAVQRKGTTISLWADGNKLVRTNGPSGTAATRSFASGTNELTIGHYNNRGQDENMRCFLDECCVSKTWRYDDTQSTYTIPDAPFEVDEHVCLILHLDNSLTSASS